MLYQVTIPAPKSQDEVVIDGIRRYGVVELHRLVDKGELRLPPSGGGTFEVSIAAATAVLGFDMFQNATWKTSAINRIIRAFGLAGSAVVGDCSVSLRVGQTEVVSKFNSALLFPKREEMISVNARVPAGMPIGCIITDAPATSVLNALIDIAP
jgi:hypothetical protein